MIRGASILLWYLIMSGIAYSQPAASSWPTRPVSLVVSNVAGSAGDFFARVLARDLTGRLGQPIIIENHGGAGGVIGTRQVAKAAPDGYKLSYGSPTSYVAAPYVFTNLAYDPTKDLVPISMVGRAPYALVAYPGLGIRNVLDLVALAKSKPGTLNLSSNGEGSVSHLGMVIFAEKMGLKLHHVPYKSTAQSITDVVTGLIHLQLASISPIISLYQSKKIQVLGIAGKHRIPLMKDVPTMAEAGVADFEHNFWMAIFGPAGIQPDIIARLNREVGAALQTDGVKKAFVELGVEPEHSTPEELGEILRRDIAAYRDIATKVGIPRR